MLRWMLVILVLLAGQFTSPVFAQQEQVISHTLSFPRKNNQYVHVVSTWPVSSDRLELSLPSWTPGSYLIRDFASNLEQLRAYGADGSEAAVRKTAKNRWQIDTRGLSRVVIEYDVWAGDLGVAKSWVESGVALLNGAGIFLYSKETRSFPQQVNVNLPDSWASVHTAMRSSANHQFVASDYDELVDSPIVAGNTVALDFEVDGQPYSLVLSGENRLWDNEKSVEDISKIVKVQQDFWDVNPFDRKFIFFNFFMGKFGGLEHDHSTVMMCSPWQMRGSHEYTKWLGLVSHEFFHSWNVRRMRPQALDEYDYDQEVYTRELWLAEGLSSYYDNLLLFRGGLIDVGEYFELLAEEFRIIETTPGRKIRSAELASFDTWIKQYRPDDNKANSTISYYRKGTLIGFVSDMAIRRETRGKHSLDTVMRRMYANYGQRARGQNGYPPGAFEDEVEAVAGTGVRKIVENMLETTEDPDIDLALAWYGLQLDRGTESGVANGAREPALAGVGVKWGNSGSQLLVEQVIQGYAGARAGILPGDELLAIDGIRVTTEDFLSFFQKLKPDELVDFTLVRHNRLITLPVRLQNEIPGSYVIRPDSKINNREKARMESWLGRDLKFIQ